MNDTAPPTLDPATAGLMERIAYVQATVANMTADKTAEIPTKAGGKFSYSYMTKSALMQMARSQFSPLGVAIIPSQQSIEQAGNRTHVTMQLTLRYKVDEFIITGSAYGHADDDKGPAKARTTAVRLMLADLLLQGGDEVEGNVQEDSFREATATEVPGEVYATAEQLKYAHDLVCRAQLDKAMPTASHAILRLARAIVQQPIGVGMNVPDALHLIPQAAASKLIEKIENVKPVSAKAVWDGVAKWELEQGLSPDVEPSAEERAEYLASDADIPF